LAITGKPHRGELGGADAKGADRQREQGKVDFHAMTPSDRLPRRHLIRSQKHDINHKKTKVNEMAKDFCEIDNNGGDGRAASPSSDN
jgi:hypothetical protein